MGDGWQTLKRWIAHGVGSYKKWHEHSTKTPGISIRQNYMALAFEKSILQRHST